MTDPTVVTQIADILVHLDTGSCKPFPTLKRRKQSFICDEDYVDEQRLNNALKYQMSFRHENR